MTEIHTGGDTITQPLSETSRLATLVLSQIEYSNAAKLRLEQAEKAVQEAVNQRDYTAYRANQAEERAASTLEELYESYNRELEAAHEQHDAEAFVSIIDGYADMIVALAQTTTAPTHPDYADTVEQAQAVAERLRGNARTMQAQLDSIIVAYVPLQSWSTEPIASPAPVLVTQRSSDGELALDLCRDQLSQ